ncbi:MAG: hypothetical protein ACMXYA_02975 [Candidatus Woesearchaeota archaeon]
MTLTRISLKKETRLKLKQLAKESESWDDVLNRLYENEITIQNAHVFLGSDTLSLDEALEEI